jgi:hypothetical protein
MYVVPRDPVAQYGGYDGTDFGFISETLALRGEEPVPHREIVAMIRPPTVRSGLAALGDPTKIKRVSKRWARYALALLRGART